MTIYEKLLEVNLLQQSDIPVFVAIGVATKIAGSDNPCSRCPLFNECPKGLKIGFEQCVESLRGFLAKEWEA